MQQECLGLHLSLGDLAVKVLVALIMLIPFRLLLKLLNQFKFNKIFIR